MHFYIERFKFSLHSLHKYNNIIFDFHKKMSYAAYYY